MAATDGGWVLQCFARLLIGTTQTVLAEGISVSHVQLHTQQTEPNGCSVMKGKENCKPLKPWASTGAVKQSAHT